MEGMRNDNTPRHGKGTRHGAGNLNGATGLVPMRVFQPVSLVARSSRFPPPCMAPSVLLPCHPEERADARCITRKVCYLHALVARKTFRWSVESHCELGSGSCSAASSSLVAHADAKQTAAVLRQFDFFFRQTTCLGTASLLLTMLEAATVNERSIRRSRFRSCQDLGRCQHNWAQGRVDGA
jgi:hypothetical protein